MPKVALASRGVRTLPREAPAPTALHALSHLLRRPPRRRDPRPCPPPPPGRRDTVLPQRAAPAPQYHPRRPGDPFAARTVRPAAGMAERALSHRAPRPPGGATADGRPCPAPGRRDVRRRVHGLLSARVATPPRPRDSCDGLRRGGGPQPAAALLVGPARQRCRRIS